MNTIHAHKTYSIILKKPAHHKFKFVKKMFLCIEKKIISKKCLLMNEQMKQTIKIAYNNKATKVFSPNVYSFLCANTLSIYIHYCVALYNYFVSSHPTYIHTNS